MTDAAASASSSPPRKSKSFFVEVQGVLEPWNSNVGDVLFAMMYRPYPGDVFVSCYPCSGGTWVSLLLYALTHSGQMPADHAQLLRDVLFLEGLGRKVEDVAPPRRLKTHLPAKKLRLSQAAKYVYVVRDYRDCCVSLYEQMVARASDYRFAGATFDDYFQRFVAGQVEDNDYFDHVASWWERHRSPNFFFLLLENLKKNFEQVVADLGEFLDGPAGRLVRDDCRLKELRELCTYDCSKPGAALLPPEYLRDGKCYINCLHCCGRWQAKLSNDQAAKLDRRFAERTKGTSLEDLFSTSASAGCTAELN